MTTHTTLAVAKADPVPLNNNQSPGDGAMEDDLTEERDATPEERSDVADTQPQDP